MNGLKYFIYTGIVIIILTLCLTTIVKLDAYYFPGKEDYNCSSFETKEQMEMIYRDAGGPLNDPYDLSRGTSTIPCKNYKYQ